MIGSLLLIGIRDFSKGECDVIEVYNQTEIERLKQMPDIDLSEMHKYTNINSSAAGDLEEDISDMVVFSKKKETIVSITSIGEFKEDEKEGDIINIDDI
jgi:carbamate kinase